MLLRSKINFKKFLFTALVSLFVTLLTSLGVWQLKRLQYKNHLLKLVLDNTKLEPINYNQLEQLIQKNLEQNLYRKVKLSGRFIHDKEIFIYAGGRYSKYPEGYILFTPLLLADKKIIMINRGFIPTHLKDQSTRFYTLPSQIIDIEGYLMRGEKQSWAIPSNDLKKNIWFSIDLEQMQQYVGSATEPYFISQAYQNEKYPRGEILNISIRNNHLAYALTWFGLAIALIFIYYLAHKKYV